MRWDSVFEVVFIAFLIGLAVYMRYHPDLLRPPQESAAAQHPTSVCDRTELAPTAAADCRAALKAAKTEADRKRVERIFGLSDAHAGAP